MNKPLSAIEKAIKLLESNDYTVIKKLPNKPVFEVKHGAKTIPFLIRRDAERYVSKNKLKSKVLEVIHN